MVFIPPPTIAGLSSDLLAGININPVSTSRAGTEMTQGKDFLATLLAIQMRSSLSILFGNSDDRDESTFGGLPGVTGSLPGISSLNSSNSLFGAALGGGLSPQTFSVPSLTGQLIQQASRLIGTKVELTDPQTGRLVVGTVQKVAAEGSKIIITVNGSPYDVSTVKSFSVQ